MLLTLVGLLLAVVYVLRVGGRVWSVAVFDPAQAGYVEQVYLPQRAQAEEALAAVLEAARAQHAYYAGDAGAPRYAAAHPGFAQRYLLRPVRRSVDRDAAAAPAAVAQLAAVLTPVVEAYAIVDTKAGTRLAVLPTAEQAEAALEARRQAVAKEVEGNLPRGGKLRSVSLVQAVEVRPAPRCPLSEVLEVPAAVAELSGARARPNTHTVVAGDTLESLAAKYAARLGDLRSWNPSVDFRRLKVGTKVVVRRSEAPLTVLTVEHRTFSREGGPQTMEVRRHDGLEISRQPVSGGGGG